MSSRAHLLLLRAVSLFLVGIGTAWAVTGDPVPLWEFDLDKVGYTQPNGKSWIYARGLHEPIFFLDSKTLAVTYPVDNSHVGLTTSESPGGRYVFATALLDVGSGEVQKQGTWGNVFDAFAIAPVAGSRLVVLDRLGISLYDKSFRQLARISHERDTVATEGPPRSPQSRKLFPDVNIDYRLLKVSPTGNTFVAVHSGGHAAVVYVLDSTSLDKITEVKQSTMISFSSDASDTIFVFANWALGLPARAQLHLVPFRPPERPSSTISLNDCGEPKFVTDHLLLMTGPCSELLLLDDKGQQIAARDLGGYRAANLGPSRDGSRFAVDLFKVKPGSSWLDRPPKLVDGRLVVYDTVRLDPIFVLWPRPRSSIKYRGSYALSPDGNLLAVLRDNRVMLYRVGN